MDRFCFRHLPDEQADEEIEIRTAPQFLNSLIYTAKLRWLQTLEPGNIPFMKLSNLNKFISKILFAIVLLALPTHFFATPLPQSPPDIGVAAHLSSNNVRRGRAAQALVVMDIPPGFHVNSSRPLEKFLIATQLQIEAPNGVRVGPVLYPRAVLRTLKFSKSKVSVYEGRATMRINVTVPANFGSDSLELKARLRYQSCSDEVCFPPQTRQLTIPIKVAGK